jgi:hypothetical protein
MYRVFGFLTNPEFKDYENHHVPLLLIGRQNP